uniref:Uncharacterized protein n=1 Tax=Pyricularia oryzae (strain 70-15 / ATCC MYA-4617 / FGSC 8958) TaxID=242507 RepID=Q2KEB1_PYRO7|nr:hypothetical protein MGCH7_ch7g1125 [Pyricularia oryzae 70-15]
MHCWCYAPDPNVPLNPYFKLLDFICGSIAAVKAPVFLGRTRMLFTVSNPAQQPKLLSKARPNARICHLLLLVQSLKEINFVNPMGRAVDILQVPAGKED